MVTGDREVKGNFKSGKERVQNADRCEGKEKMEKKEKKEKMEQIESPC